MSTQVKELVQALALIGVLLGSLALVIYGISFIQAYSSAQQTQTKAVEEQRRIQQLQSHALLEIQTQNKAIGAKQDEIDNRITELKSQVQRLLP